LAWSRFWIFPSSLTGRFAHSNESSRQSESDIIRNQTIQIGMAGRRSQDAPLDRAATGNQAGKRLVQNTDTGQESARPYTLRRYEPIIPRGPPARSKPRLEVILIARRDGGPNSRAKGRTQADYNSTPPDANRLPKDNSYDEDLARKLYVHRMCPPDSTAGGPKYDHGGVARVLANGQKNPIPDQGAAERRRAKASDPWLSVGEVHKVEAPPDPRRHPRPGGGGPNGVGRSPRTHQERREACIRR